MCCQRVKSASDHNGERRANDLPFRARRQVRGFSQRDARGVRPSPSHDRTGPSGTVGQGGSVAPSRVGSASVEARLSLAATPTTPHAVTGGTPLPQAGLPAARSTTESRRCAQHGTACCDGVGAAVVHRRFWLLCRFRRVGFRSRRRRGNGVTGVCAPRGLISTSGATRHSAQTAKTGDSPPSQRRAVARPGHCA